MSSDTPYLDVWIEKNASRLAPLREGVERAIRRGGQLREIEALRAVNRALQAADPRSAAGALRAQSVAEAAELATPGTPTWMQRQLAEIEAARAANAARQARAAYEPSEQAIRDAWHAAQGSE